MRPRPIPTLVTILSLSLFLVLPFAVEAGPWHSHLRGKVSVQIQKPLVRSEGEPTTVGVFPPEVLALFGSHTVDYDRFTVTWVHRNVANQLQALAVELNVRVDVDDYRQIWLASHRFPTTEPGRRFPKQGRPPIAIPELWVVQYAYPFKAAWRAELEDCGVTVLSGLGSGSFLVRAPTMATMTECPAGQYLGWIDAYHSTDRHHPNLFAAFDIAPEISFDFVLAPGTTEGLFQAEIGPEVEIRHFEVRGSGASFAVVTVAEPTLTAFLESSSSLLMLQASATGISLSGERQAMVAAGEYDPTDGTVDPGYGAFLNVSGRNLLNSTTAPGIAIFDSGINEGPQTTPPIRTHAAVKNPRGYIDIVHENPIPDRPQDAFGHGTIVASIAAGNLTHGFRDGDLFLYSAGISPNSELFEVKITDYRTNGSNPCSPESIFGGANDASVLEDLQEAFEWTTAQIPQRPLIANNSWGETILPLIRCGENFYGVLSGQYEKWTRDADDDVVSGFQPMTMVFAAGNRACNFSGGCDQTLDCQGNTPRTSSLDSPATAKNVIAVGSVQNAYPFGSCSNSSKIYRVVDNSARGDFFEIGSWPDRSGSRLHNTRVKPDLVAPGERVHGAVPYNDVPKPTNPPGPYDCPFAGCEIYSPLTLNPAILESFTYGGGTSYAAPVVSGAAALFTDWMGIHQSVTPSPSLVKAALIATADELTDFDNSNQCWMGDCRPSHRAGWGRVNIGRLTDPLVNHVFANEDIVLFTGGSDIVAANLRVDEPTKDVLIVLVWSDDGDVPVATESLVNDLTLEVYSDLGSAVIPNPIDYLGNNFNENIQSIEDGYSYAFTPYMFAYAARPDHTNNVEAVFIPASAYESNRRFQIEVKGFEVNSPGGQDFSVFAYNLEPAP